MSKAIGYTRISTKDQSNFSLPAQEKYIRDCAARQDLELVTIFKDDGQSAKNFDRPDWKSLEKFIREKNDVEVLIVAKYDRFSRNVSEALRMIELLEERYQVKIISAMEPIALHPQSPYFFQFRTTMLLGAQVEWLVIKDRTRAGIRQANISGRVVNKAPVGYLNKRDNHNKPIIIVDTDRAPAISKVFDLFLQGYSPKQIYNQVRNLGINLSGHSAIQRILTNPIYAGLVRAKSYYEEPEKIVKGIHEAIVPEATWWKVQTMLSGQAKKQGSFSSDFPLKGVLRHSCGKIFTAAFARGKKKRIGYYRCMNDNRNINAKRLHEKIDEILTELSLPQFYIDYLRQAVLRSIHEGTKSNRNKYEQKKKELLQLEKKLTNLEEDRITRAIDVETFQKWQRKYQGERAILLGQLEDLSQPVDEVMQRYFKSLPLLSNLRHTYHLASTELKQRILLGVFEHGIIQDEDHLRTPSILPVFAQKAMILKEKGLLIVEQPCQNLNQTEECSPYGSIIEPLTTFLGILSQVKTA